ncbi:helix-turn-helix domain-containing protein [Lachnospiraceae bacterium CLA-AA-H58]|uniref:helix-turn-helix domain-containing protein n=1 Tax=Pilosibacter fragilis TaxID=3078042 RepID=UPI0032D497FA
MFSQTPHAPSSRGTSSSPPAENDSAPLTGCRVHSFHAYEKYGNVREAAESLGMTPSTFVRKRQKYTKDAD